MGKLKGKHKEIRLLSEKTLAYLDITTENQSSLLVLYSVQELKAIYSLELT